MRKLEVKLKENTGFKTKWYYKTRHKHLFEKPFIVTEEEEEPVFTESYRYDNGTLFIDKCDCIILNIL